jgi:hypothetical protein
MSDISLLVIPKDSFFVIPSEARDLASDDA